MNDPRQTALEMVQQDKTSIDDLRIRYFANGGNADPVDFEAYIHCLLDADEYDPAILSWAVDDISGG